MRDFYACKQEEGKYEYDSFVQNYYMYNMGKTVNELNAMLKLQEKNLPKRDAPALHAIRAGKVQKKQKNKKPQLASWRNNKRKGKTRSYLKELVLQEKQNPIGYGLLHDESNNSSFLDYAFESVARILNMVLTKKVEKTPNEVWYGQALKLSYLKVWGCEEAIRSLEDLEIIQEEDMHPSKNTSSNHNEQNQEIDEPKSDIITIGELHWTAVKNILKYLCNTKDMFLVYGGDIKRELRVSCYNDAGYLTDADDLKSQTGYVFVLNGGAIDWKSTKQSNFATSSTEAEYIAVSDTSKEVVWVIKFIVGLGVVLTIEEPIKMYCDNTGASTIANERESPKVLDIIVPKFTICER
nr:retrotransposon protein, putative, Ty1-copia subclass [Tanacetum cinerariifolium]